MSESEKDVSRMLASGLAVEGGGGLGGHSLHFAHPHMAAFSAPPVPEFLRPLPKPAPLVPQTRYNGGPPRSKYESPVNLVQQKDITEDEYTSMFSSRFFPPPPPHHLSHYSSLQGPYGALYPGHYTPMLPRDRPGLPPATTPLSPLEAFPSPHSSTPDSPSTFSPPVTNKVSSLSLSSSTPSSSSCSSSLSTTTSSSAAKERKFKVPSGKEGSLKHRILTTTPATAGALNKHLKRKHSSAAGAEVPASFSRGSLIQLANGELRRVEDMRTEDFVSSAERSAALRLDPSTVIRIKEEPAKEVNLITLSYGEHRTQVEIESAAEHPYFVFNRGWASCDPDKTLTTYGLKCHRLQVGDVCISLSPRPQNAATAAQLSATTAQLTASAAQLEAISSQLASSASSCKKRRWSAPDQLDAILGGVAPPTTISGSSSTHQQLRKSKD
ncbi:hypothetical protein LSTR_LSTR011557 [Laodelphax striatellus]|uniref:AXH domain-containing protein n=1 Tax=Laodelphax striatellus TaxID=195883 RepID=A0A482X9R9_LAOST|nr:hypothetical protein LSTR_LSTR011557 [Laodelphax striatellus]